MSEVEPRGEAGVPIYMSLCVVRWCYTAVAAAVVTAAVLRGGCVSNSECVWLESFWIVCGMALIHA